VAHHGLFWRAALLPIKKVTYAIVERTKERTGTPSTVEAEYVDGKPTGKKRTVPSSEPKHVDSEVEYSIAYPSAGSQKAAGHGSEWTTSPDPQPVKDLLDPGIQANRPTLAQELFPNGVPVEIPIPPAGK
jgi:hypothetical protein